MVAKVDFNVLMENETIKAIYDEYLPQIEADPIIDKLVQTAEKIEDLYEEFKKCVDIAFDQFKQLFEDSYDYCVKKMEIADDDLEMVAGGGLFSKIGNFAKKHAVLLTCIGVGALAITGVGAFAGFVAAGSIGLGLGINVAGTAALGAAIGAVVRGFAGAGTYAIEKAIATRI